MATKPTIPRASVSMRLDPLAVELLDAIGRHRAATGDAGQPSRGEVIEALLRRMHPPQELTATSRAVRVAHKNFMEGKRASASS
jgi:hypothetical protein